jgi:hypothetical protein
MPIQPFNLARIQTEVLSDKQAVRGQAMQDLLMQVQKDPQIHAAALQIFRGSLQNAQDGWTTNSAISGIEHIAGPEEARKARLALLNHPSAELVSAVVLRMEDRSYLPTLIELLSRRSETKIQDRRHSHPGPHARQRRSARASEIPSSPRITPGDCRGPRRPERPPRNPLPPIPPRRQNRRLAGRQSRPNAARLRLGSRRHQAPEWAERRTIASAAVIR